MTSPVELDRSIPGTAYLTALYRALESERPDALFADPYARLLAGEQGEEILRQTPQVHVESWGVAVRTHVFDTFILRLLQEGSVDTVLNLAAGLDTRPYRLALPATLRWIELDLPTIIAYKETKLANEQPHCIVERVALDLLDTEARQAYFALLTLQTQRVLLITEGLLGYLLPAQVEVIAADVHAQPIFRWWITEFLPSYVLRASLNSSEPAHAPGDERVRFAPHDGVNFFVQRGWKLVEYRSLLGAAYRLKRHVPLGWLLRSLEFVNRITSDDPRSYRHAGGFILLEKRAREQEGPAKDHTSSPASHYVQRRATGVPSRSGDVEECRQLHTQTSIDNPVRI